MMKTSVNRKVLVHILACVFIVLLISCGDDVKETEATEIKKNISNTFSLADQKIFGIKSGIIEYEISGSQTGSRKLYFDDWGRKQAEYSNTTIKVGKYSKHSNLLKITDSDWQYIIDLDKKTGTKRENPVIEKLFELKDQMDYSELGEQLIFINGGFESGNEKVAGRECTTYEFKKKNSKSWIWNWLMLKSEIATVSVKIIILATKIEENISIPDSVFKFPPNVLITEVDLERLRNQEEQDQF